MPPAPESWLSKLEWRLEHGLSRPAQRAIRELSTSGDPRVIRTLVEALSYRDQDVRENAARALERSGQLHAEGALWGEAAEALRAAAAKAPDDEERRSMERAACNIEARLKDPPTVSSSIDPSSPRHRPSRGPKE